MAGSVADRVMRHGVSEAAEGIVDEIEKVLPK